MTDPNPGLDSFRAFFALDADAIVALLSALVILLSFEGRRLVTYLIGLLLFYILEVIRVQIKIQWNIANRVWEYVFIAVGTLIVFAFTWVMLVLTAPQRAAEIHSYALEYYEQPSDVEKGVTEETSIASTEVPDHIVTEDEYGPPIRLRGEESKKARKKFNPLKNWGMEDNDKKPELLPVDSINAARCEKNSNLDINPQIDLQKDGDDTDLEQHGATEPDVTQHGVTKCDVTQTVATEDDIKPCVVTECDVRPNEAVKVDVEVVCVLRDKTLDKAAEGKVTQEGAADVKDVHHDDGAKVHADADVSQEKVAKDNAKQEDVTPVKDSVKDSVTRNGTDEEAPEARLSSVKDELVQIKGAEDYMVDTETEMDNDRRSGVTEGDVTQYWVADDVTNSEYSDGVKQIRDYGTDEEVSEASVSSVTDEVVQIKCEDHIMDTEPEMDNSRRSGVTEGDVTQYGVADDFTNSEGPESVRKMRDCTYIKRLIDTDDDDATPDVPSVSASTSHDYDQRRLSNTTTTFGSSLASVGDTFTQPERRDSQVSCWPVLSAHSTISLLGLGAVTGFVLFKMWKLK